MKAIGALIAVAGIAVIVYELVMACTSYHLSHSHDSHRFVVGLAIGFAIAIVGGLVVRQSNQ